MANPEDIERARQGKDAWNAWAEENPEAEADFSRTQLNVIDFAGFVFPGKANFGGAQFLDNAPFIGAKFCSEACFAGAEFFIVASFSQAVFKNSAPFDGAKFHRVATFAGAQFHDLAAFNDANFTTTTDFTDCTFAYVPTFHGAKLHEGTTFEAVTWPERPHEKQSPYDAVRAWARLRVEMNRLHKHEDELSFFAKELGARARDRRNEPLVKRSLYRSYLALGAGRSVAKPFGWLLGLNTLLFLPIYWYATSAIQWRKLSLRDVLADIVSFNIPADVVSFTLSQALPLIGGSNPERVDLYRRLFARADSTGIDVPLWLEFVGTFQQLVGVVLLFMIGLALRNRFRMK